jgi:hypothetical protein
MKKAPLQQVKERFKDKDGLVAAVRDLAKGDLWVDRLAEDDGLERVSNAKLLRLHKILTDVKGQFGSRKALVDAILKAEGRQKDDGYASRLGAQPLPRLWDHYKILPR